MAIPTNTTVQDINVLCHYLSSKATGASLKEAKAVVDAKHLDPRKLAALKTWGFLESAGDRLKVTPLGRAYEKGGKEEKQRILREIIEKCLPYAAMVERSAHKKEETTNSTEVAAHWHDHFKEEVGAADNTLNAQAIVFFNIAEGAGLGTLMVGRRGSPTRIEWNFDAINGLNTLQASKTVESEYTELSENNGDDTQKQKQDVAPKVPAPKQTLGQAIFLAHGKNRAPVEQLKKILTQFNIPFKVAVDEPNLGRPISEKVRDTMGQCNCAILVFSPDEKFINKEDQEIWRPSENVVYELGACGYLYGNRLVIIKEDKVTFPTNFRDLGYISFSDGNLDAKAMDIVKELIGFGIIKIST